MAERHHPGRAAPWHEGPPFRVDHITEADPAAGAGLAIPLDSRYWWRLFAVRFLLTTSIAVADRFVTLDIADPAGDVWARQGSQSSDSASTTSEHSFVRGATSAFGGGPITLDTEPLADVWIPPGWQLQVNVQNIDAGDQLHGFRMYVEQYPTVAGRPDE